MKNEEIEKFCNDHRDLLISLGEAFRLLRKIDPTEMHFEECKNYIETSMSKWRELNLSVTPKAHLFEDHALSQMKNVPGGLGHKTEDFVERNHQDGIRLDRRLHGLTDYEDRTRAALCYEEMGLKAPVQQHFKKVKLETSRAYKNSLDGEYCDL